MYSLDTLKRLNKEKVQEYWDEVKKGEVGCDFCDKKATHSIPVYNPADSVRDVEGAYAVYNLCDECEENGHHLEENFYCDYCGEFFILNHSWDTVATYINGIPYCQECAIKMMQPITLKDVINKLNEGVVEDWLRINNMPDKKLIFEGEYSDWSDFPGHTSLNSVAEELLEIAEGNGVKLDDLVYPVITHGYQFNVVLGVFA